MIVRFEIERNDLTPWREETARRLANRRQMNKEVADAMAAPIYANFDSLSASNQNAFGAPSTFWARMKVGTQPGADDESGWVGMPAPVALRYFGGTVVPGPGKKRLAIPANAEAYGKSPRDFSDLRLAFFGGGKLALVERQQQSVRYGGKRKDGSRAVIPGVEKGGDIYYWLVESATIAPDPAVLPTPEVLMSAGVDGLRGYLGHLERKAA